jgi:hypothetical protein
LLEKEKLNGANFMDWYHNRRIILRQEKTEYVLSEPYPEDLPVVQVPQIAWLMRNDVMMHST